ncbi:TetR/AcrR family transcriptional regulator [Enterobacter ludwigii]
MSTERSQKANDIVFFTRQLLTTGGYRSFSFADLSEKVNIRKASIHHHFSSKAELVRVVVSEYRQEARAGMQALSHQLNNPVAELQAFMPIIGPNASRTVLRHFVSARCLPPNCRRCRPKSLRK